MLTSTATRWLLGGVVGAASLGIGYGLWKHRHQPDRVELLPRPYGHLVRHAMPHERRRGNARGEYGHDRHHHRGHGHG